MISRRFKHRTSDSLRVLCALYSRAGRIVQNAELTLYLTAESTREPIRPGRGGRPVAAYSAMRCLSNGAMSPGCSAPEVVALAGLERLQGTARALGVGVFVERGREWRRVARYGGHTVRRSTDPSARSTGSDARCGGSVRAPRSAYPARCRCRHCAVVGAWSGCGKARRRDSDVGHSRATSAPAR